MTQSVDRHSTRWFSQRRLWLLVVWGVFAATLLTAWPVEPRLTLGKGEYLDVVGITPDSQELITLTERAMRDRDSGGWYQSASGPVGVWNLGSGKRRRLCVPNQTCSGELVRSGTDDGLRMVEPDGKRVIEMDPPIRGDQFVFSHLSSQNVTDWDLLALSYRSGAITPRKHGGSWLISPQARWCLESTSEEISGPSLPLRITRFGSESDQITLNVKGQLISSCFSSDDAYFAYCSSDGDHAQTSVWRLETNEAVSTIAERLHGITFSRDCQLLGGFTGPERGTDPPHNREFLLINVQTGTIIRRLKIPFGDETDRSENTLKFFDNDKWLLCLRIEHNRKRIAPSHARLNLKLAWNLETNEYLTYSNETAQCTYDSNLSKIGTCPDIPSHFVLQKAEGINEIFEITTGRKVAETPRDCMTIRMTEDTMVLQQEKERSFYSFLDAHGIVLPAIVYSIIPSNSVRWSFIDLNSGRTISTIRGQRELCWLSSDQKTLVTCPRFGESRAIHVWDFPPRRPRIKPLLWSLLVPGIVVIGFAWKYRRRFVTRTALASPSTDIESLTMESS